MSVVLPFTKSITPVREEFLIRVLAHDLILGRMPGFNSIHSLVCQAQAEGSGARFNPLATTMKDPFRLPGSTDWGSNVPPVQAYRSAAQGIYATALTLNKPAYAVALAALRMESPAVAYIDAIAASPWGTFNPVPSGLTPQQFADDVRNHWTARAWAPVPS